MLQGKRFSSDDEVIAATEAYFEAKDKSFYKKGIDSLEKRWSDCIAMEGDYVDEWSRISQKKMCFHWLVTGLNDPCVRWNHNNVAEFYRFMRLNNKVCINATEYTARS